MIEYFRGVEFANPAYLWLLLIVPLMAFWYWWRGAKSFAWLRVSTTDGWAKQPRGWRTYARHALPVFRMLAVSALIVALARPQSKHSWQNQSTYGIDIVMAVDVSSSMLARDFSPNRLEATKKVASSFISGRPYDRIGIVVFSGESFTLCPLTTDHAVLLNQLRGAKEGMLEDGTAIGMGFATAIDRLRESTVPGKVIILLSDGVNNRGNIDPLTAAELAMAYNVRVYTIGVGTTGMASFPVPTVFGIEYVDMEVEIDEKVLGEIARMTGGKYFRATDNKKLESIYQEIDRIEKARIETKDFSARGEEFLPLALAAFVLIMIEALLRYIFFRMVI